MTDEPEKSEFPPNSFKSKVGTVPPKELKDPMVATTHKIGKVVTGTIVRKKKAIWDKFAEAFFGDDAKTVISYIWWDVLIPAAKDTIVDMVTTGLKMTFYGEAGGDRTRRDRNKSYISYSSFYKDRDRDRRIERQEPLRNRARHKFDDVIIESRAEAEDVLSSLVDQIENYDVATVADFYDLVGLSTEFTDNKYGWKNLSQATVNRVQDGYILVVPRPILLE